MSDAVETIAGRPDAPIAISCEHASQRMPPGWDWPDEDRWLAGTHWAYDLGAADIARELASALEAPAVLSRFTRLLVDPNRAPDSPGAFREVAEGRTIALNRGLDDVERARRIELLHRPYHDALDAAIGASRAPIVFAVHTFTPLYEGRPRAVEVGVLFDEEEELAVRMHESLLQEKWRAELNEPYSGRAGLIYSADRHAKKYGRRPLEIEVRQDLAEDRSARERIVALLARFFRAKA